MDGQDIINDPRPPFNKYIIIIMLKKGSDFTKQKG